MTTIDEVLGRCKYHVQMRNNQNHFMRCYDCNGTRFDAEQTQCPYYIPYMPVRVPMPPFTASEQTTDRQPPNKNQKGGAK